MTTSTEKVERIVETCRQAARANRELPFREGNVVQLTSARGEELLLAADLHGQRLNFLRLREIAALDERPGRHLAMQEVCHGGPEYPNGQGCMSHLLLEDMAAMKARYPDRFHFLLSNHEMAEWAEYPIAKGQRLLNLCFRDGIRAQYGENAQRVREAYVEFLSSCPLALRLENRVFVSHSAPENADREEFDMSVFDRPLTIRDILPQGPAFRLVWGRDFRADNAHAFARLVRADVLIHGHEPCPGGYNTPNPIQVILDSSGPCPSYVLLPIAEPLTQRQVVDRIRRLP